MTFLSNPNRRSGKMSAALAVALLMGATLAQAVPVVFTGTNGTVGGSVTFDKSGTTLTVTLAATGGDVLDPTQVLTTVFFSAPGAALTPLSALVAAGSVGINGAPSAGGNVGGEWSYKTGISQYGANSGISSTGLGIFDSGSANFGGADLDGLGNGSIGYGLLSSGDNTSTGNNPVVTPGGAPLVKNAVVFTLGGFTAELSAISNVTFQWGTALTEPSSPGTPGPGVPEGGSTAVLLGAAFSALGFAARRFRA